MVPWAKAISVNLGNQSTLPNFVVDTSGTGNLTGIKAIAAGYSNSLALMSTGEVLVWGSNFGSSLGQNLTISQLFQSRIPLKVKDTAGTGTLNVGTINGVPQSVSAIPLTLHNYHGTFSPSPLHAALLGSATLSCAPAPTRTTALV